MGRRRVPETDSAFDSFIINSSKYLESGTPTNAVRLGLTAVQTARWLEYRDRWKEIYKKYTNPNTRTTTVTKDKNALKQEFFAFAVKAGNKIAGSENLTNEDCNMFNIAHGKRTRTPRGSMSEDIIMGSLQSVGGGIIHVRTRMMSSEGRPRKHPMADAIEMRYVLLDVKQNFTTPMIGVHDCTHATFSRTALWRIQLDAEHIGQRLIAFFRYVNHAKPEHNSAWSQMAMVIVG
jgi:hypothetical protein